MPTSRAFAYNPSLSAPTGATQFGNLAVQSTGWTAGCGGLQWFNGPDEDLGYAIGYPYGGPKTSGSVSQVISGTSVGFRRTATFSDATFLSSVLNLTGQSFLTASNAKTYLNNNGYWTSYGSSFESDAQAFITAANITDSTQQTAINNLVIGLKADSLWTTLDAIYPFVGGTALKHKWNLKDPRDLDAAYRLQFNGGMTHSSNGILFNGTNGWADTSGYNYNVNSFGCYTRNTTDNLLDYMGSQGTEAIDDGEGPYLVFVNGFQLARNRFVMSSRNNFGSTNNTISTGLSVVTKAVPYNGQALYFKNGTQKGTSNIQINSTTPIPPIAIGALNPNSDLSAGTFGIEGYSNQEIAFAFIGNSLNVTQNTNLYTRVQAFQTTLGRQV